MVYQLITFKSPEVNWGLTVNPTTATVLNTSSTDGLDCTWKAQNLNGLPKFTWHFNWDKLKPDRVIGFAGQIIIKKPQEEKIPVDLTKEVQLIEKPIPGVLEGLTTIIVQFEYSLLPILSTEIYDEMFLPSEKTDAVLELDGMKLNINRAFLAFHSDFFSALFSSNFKEGKMDDIPLKEVSYEEIGLLFSVIYPKTMFPNDKNIPKLLELADRFMMPSVIHHVEYHLLNNTKIDNEKMMWMADRYGMELLLEKMIKELDNVVKAKKLKASPDYMDLSDKTKGKILDKVMTII